jgi:hypothetical protein
MIESMGKAYSNGRMVENIKGNGSMGSRKEWGCTSSRTKKSSTGSGRTEDE